MKLPKPLKGKKAVINLEGVPDGQCFRYSVQAGIYRKQELISQKQRIAKRYKQFMAELNFENISKPTNTKEDIDMFERQTPKYATSVFQWKEEEKDKKKIQVTLIRSSIGKKTSSKSILMLLLMKGDDARYHYLPIANLDRLLNSQAGPHNRIWCERCLHPLYRQWRGDYKKPATP